MIPADAVVKGGGGGEENSDNSSENRRRSGGRKTAKVGESTREGKTGVIGQRKPLLKREKKIQWLGCIMNTLKTPKRWHLGFV